MVSILKILHVKTFFQYTGTQSTHVRHTYAKYISLHVFEPHCLGFQSYIIGSINPDGTM